MSTPASRSRVLALTAALALTATSPFRANASPMPVDGPTILRAFCNYVGAATTLSVRVTFDVRMEDESTMTTIQHLTIARPLRFALRLQEGLIGLTLVSDGKTLQTHAPFLQVYSIEPAPPHIALATQRGTLWATAIASGMGGVPIVEALLADAPCGPLEAAAGNIEFMGTQDLDGERCHFIRCEAAEFYWTVWISDSPTPLIRKIVPVFKPRPGQPRMQMSLRFSDWRINTATAPDAFTFTPPPGAEKVDSVLELMLAEREEPMAGKPLPPLRLQLLSGDVFETTQSRGKNPVILYFWSLRDERTIKGLFQLMSLAPRLRESGVQLCAVNTSDTREGTLQAILRLGIDVPVALDIDNVAAKTLGVTSVPWTLLTDRDGLILRRIIGIPQDFLAGIELQMLPPAPEVGTNRPVAIKP